MKIIAKRPFISSRRGVGNVPEGRILDIDDDYAGSLIKAGLAEKYADSPALRASAGSSFFLTPNKESQENGPSLQAARVSQPPIARKSKPGGRKTKTAAS